MAIKRWRMRIGRAFKSRGDVAGQLLLPVLVSIAGLSLLALVWRSAISPHANAQSQAIGPILQGQAVNALSIAVVALAAWIAFQLRYRRAKNLYLRLSQISYSEDVLGMGTTERAKVTSALEQIAAVRPLRSLLIITHQNVTDSDMPSLLVSQLVGCNLVPVVVEIPSDSLTADVPVMAQDSFVSKLAGSTGDETRARRLFRREADRGKVIVVVLGLDQLAEAKPRVLRRSLVEAALRSALSARVPFVAVISNDLAPRIPEVAAIRLHGHTGSRELLRHMVTLLRKRGLHMEPDVEASLREKIGNYEGNTDLWHLELAADIIAGRARAGQGIRRAINEVFAEGNTRRRNLEWMCEWAVNSDVDTAALNMSSAVKALKAIGIQAHFRQELTCSWNDTTAEFKAHDKLLFAAGVSVLERRNVLTAAGDVGNEVLRFNRSEWLSFAGALGLGLEKDRWSELLMPGMPQATVDALTAALILNATSRSQVSCSYLTELSRLTKGRVNDLTLEMIVGVIAAIQATHRKLKLGSREMTVLRQAWRASSDVTKLQFVSLADVHPAIVDFLWEQVVPPQFHANSYRVRKSIGYRLASMGTITWQRLAGDWKAVVQAGRDPGLSVRSRLDDKYWDECGLPFASICWTLPSLTNRLSDDVQHYAEVLLREMREVVTLQMGASEVVGKYIPDIGLEISLAEGFKMAAVQNRDRAAEGPDIWQAEAARMYIDAVSWTSRQVLIQAFAITGPSAQPRPGTGIATTLGGQALHPFVRETAALARRAARVPAGTESVWPRRIKRNSSNSSELERDIWFDDVEELAGGGYGLSAEAHRLLALSTLLTNMAEGAFERAVNQYRAAKDRRPSDAVMQELQHGASAFTSSSLPKCFTSPINTATMLEVECDCPFRLCGPAVARGVGLRRISKAFAQRAEVTARVPLALGRKTVFVRHAFSEVWRHPGIARENAS